MTKIAIVEVIVPDHIKPDDDVFNYMRSNACRMKLKDFMENPEDPPLTKVVRIVTVTYMARGAEDAAKIENDINNELTSVKGVTEVKFI